MGVAEPHLGLRQHGEDNGGRPIYRERVESRQRAGKAKAHDAKVDRRRLAVISREADHAQAKISRSADGKIARAADDARAAAS